ncbi:phage tail assembly chaperone [Spartinivicinus ruber]|uniref:phage tail assembly chaperone n=1 Tax=Spartinivicinus ruber TaxID=2683272 RepID=UPI0013D3D0D1|nr:phage tail assembly chaperone [Spartinivicinus ruber]
MVSMTDFFTREKANTGIKLPLTLPDGTETEHYLVIRGVDSDFYQEAVNETRRLVLLDAKNKNSEYTNKEAELTILASLVADWSFDEECTPENIKKFLREAPQIAPKIDSVAGDRSLFFGKKQSN